MLGHLSISDRHFSSAATFLSGAVVGAAALLYVGRRLQPTAALSSEPSPKLSPKPARKPANQAAPSPAAQARLDELERDGMVVIEDVYTPAQVTRLRKQYNHCWKHVSSKLKKLKWKTRTYTTEKQSEQTFFMSNALYHGKKIAAYDDSEVIDMGGGRYDFYWGLYGEGMTGSDEFLKAPKVKEVLDGWLRTCYSGYTGALPALAGHGTDGMWHRDEVHLWDDEDVQLSLPPLYCTMLVPLTDISLDDGPTEFLPGSHHINFNALGINSKEKINIYAEGQETKKALVKAGSVCIFDGKVLHRGTRNISGKTRDLLYVVYQKNWYTDEENKGEYVDE